MAAPRALHGGPITFKDYEALAKRLHVAEVTIGHLRRRIDRLEFPSPCNVSPSVLAATMARIAVLERFADDDVKRRRRIVPIPELERDAILAAVATSSSRDAAARALGIGPATLYRKLAEYGVPATGTRRTSLATPDSPPAPCP